MNYCMTPHRREANREKHSCQQKPNFSLRTRDGNVNQQAGSQNTGYCLAYNRCETTALQVHKRMHMSMTSQSDDFSRACEHTVTKRSRIHNAPKSSDWILTATAPIQFSIRLPVSYVINAKAEIQRSCLLTSVTTHHQQGPRGLRVEKDIFIRLT